MVCKHPNKPLGVSIKRYFGLIKYLTRYLVTRLIGLSTILDYFGDKVKHYYKSYTNKCNECEELYWPNDVVYFTKNFLRAEVLWLTI